LWMLKYELGMSIKQIQRPAESDTKSPSRYNGDSKPVEAQLLPPEVEVVLTEAKLESSRRTRIAWVSGGERRSKFTSDRHGVEICSRSGPALLQQEITRAAVNVGAR